MITSSSRISHNPPYPPTSTPSSPSTPRHAHAMPRPRQLYYLSFWPSLFNILPITPQRQAPSRCVAKTPLPLPLPTSHAHSFFPIENSQFVRKIYFERSRVDWEGGGWPKDGQPRLSLIENHKKKKRPPVGGEGNGGKERKGVKRRSDENIAELNLKIRKGEEYSTLSTLST